jgi:hypothetical protein
VYGNYVYIIPTQVGNKSTAENQITRILETYQQENIIAHTIRQLDVQENKYVKLLTRMHPDIANEITQLKQEYNNIFYQCQPSNIRRLQERINNTITQGAIITSGSDITSRQENIDECNEKEFMM